MPGKCKFNPKWIKNTSISKIEKWLREDPKNPANAICTSCKATFNIEHSGIGAVRKHAAGVGHKALTSDKQTTLPFATPRSSSTSGMPSTSRSFDAPGEITPTSTKAVEIPAAQMHSYLLSESGTKAEIIWAIDRVMQHFSLRDGEEASS